ncbi:MAG: V-type ATP synthase subunit A, partial [Oscillospiraceae bacterium]
MNTIHSINGPVVTVKNATDFMMLEMVFVGNKNLIGEVIAINDNFTTIQVYETTTGLQVGEPIEKTNSLMSATLGPGIISNIFDGIERPLKDIEKQCGAFIDIGSNVPALDIEKLWKVTILVKEGDFLNEGQIYATTPESDLILHKCMVPPQLSGTVKSISQNGNYKINDTIVTLSLEDGSEYNLTLCQKWPIRMSRPFKKRDIISKPLITGQRVIDTLFPIAKGGTAAVPGGFGTGKTMTQHQLAKWCDADIIVYIGCGERGNEMTQVLKEFSQLIDPKSGRPLTDRTVLIANTSNMPVAAREASIYTGI